MQLLVLLVSLFGSAGALLMEPDAAPLIIAVTAEGPEMTSQVSPRFGQTRYFTIVNLKSDQAKTVVHLDSSRTGYDLANELTKFKANVVITGKIGSNALGVLKAAEVEVIQGVSSTVEEALSRFEAGEFQ